MFTELKSQGAKEVVYEGSPIRVRITVGRSLLVEVPEDEVILGKYSYDISRVRVRLFMESSGGGQQAVQIPGALRNRAVIEAYGPGEGEVFLITDKGRYVFVVESGDFFDSDVFIRVRNGERERALLLKSGSSDGLAFTPKELARQLILGRVPEGVTYRKLDKALYLPPFIVYYLKEYDAGRLRAWLVKVANYDDRKVYDFEELKRKIENLFSSDEIYVFFDKDTGKLYPIRKNPVLGTVSFVVVEVKK